MGLDTTRNNPVYQKPQEAKDYGKPNTNQAYDVTVAANNPGVAPTVKPIDSGGFGSPTPTKPTAYTSFNMPKPAAPAAAPPPASPYGYASGPGILEDWFNQRANGTDPAYQYALKRGGDEIDNRMAAGGSYNSGARGQQLSDFAANAMAQREGQLDTLAAGASGEHQGRLNSMFSQGLGLATGQSGINSAYDLAAGKSMSDALSALLGYTTDKAGIDSQADQGLVNNAFGLVSSIYGGGKKK